MLDGVVMDVVPVSVQIRLVPNRVFPKPSLPDSLLLLHPPRIRDGSGRSHKLAAAEGGFDQPPSHREVIVVVWKYPDAVEMVRQNNHGVDLKRIGRHHSLEAGPQEIDSRLLFEERAAFLSGDGEEEYAALHIGSLVVWHSLTGIMMVVGQPTV